MRHVLHSLDLLALYDKRRSLVHVGAQSWGFLHFKVGPNARRHILRLLVASAIHISSAIVMPPVLLSIYPYD